MSNGFCAVHYAVHVTVALVGVATLNLALPAPLTYTFAVSTPSPVYFKISMDHCQNECPMIVSYNFGYHSQTKRLCTKAVNLLMCQIKMEQ